jgi:hypothetical protein
MARDSECVICNASRPDLVGICVECDGCFGAHCDCPVCQHGKTRTDDCVFCGREVSPLLEALVQADDIESDLQWLVGHTEELA